MGDRLAKKTGISVGPILIYVGIIAALGGGLFAWDYSYRRQAEEARKPPPTDVIVKNLVENIIGAKTVKSVKVDGGTGSVEVVFESATYPPAARSEASGAVLPQGLAKEGMLVKKGDPLVSVKTSDGKALVAARADSAGRVVEVLVKPGDKLEVDQAVVRIEPADKKTARENLETEGLLAAQAILGQLSSVKAVTSKIVYRDVTLATVVGKSGSKGVTTTYHESLK